MKKYIHTALKGTLTALLLMVGVSTWADGNVAKIVETSTEYATLQAAINAATDGQTVELIADISETATYTINNKITIDFNSHKITSNHTTCTTSFAECTGKLFSIASTAELTITGNGTITDNNVHGIFCNEGKLTIENGTFTTSNPGGYAVIFNTGSTANCTVSGGTFTGAYAAVYNVSGATMTVTGGKFSAPDCGMAIKSGATLNVNAGSSEISSTNSTGAGINVVDANTTATISGGIITGHNGVFIMTNAKLIVNDGATITGSNASITGRGNAGEGNTTITINGGTMTSDDTGIYHPQIDGHLTINGGTITGGKLGVEIRSGELSVTGGSIKSNAETYSCVANDNGTTTVGAALAIAQHTTKKDISITISGGKFTGVKAISESNPQENEPDPQVTMSVTNGEFHGGITVTDVQGGFIEGGTYSEAFPATYCVEGKAPYVDENGACTIITPETEVPTDAEALSNGSYYKVLGNAITAAGTEGTTITLLKDLEGEDRSITIPADADITLEIADGKTLTKPINVEGKLAITSGTISETTITITGFDAVLKISAGVSHPAVALSTALQTDNVLKSKAAGEPAVTTYNVVPKMTAVAQLTGSPTEAENTAATNLINTSAYKAINVPGIFGANASLEITLTSVVLTGGNVTQAAFTVTPKDANGNVISTTVSDVTFRLPISTDIAENLWVNLWHNTTPMPAVKVQMADSHKYVEVTTNTFSPFSYEVLPTDPVAEIGNTKYVSVKAAVSDVTTTTATISLIADETTAFTVPAEKSITLEVGTHTISGTITNNGTLTIAENTGTISGNISNEGTLTISGGTISGTVSASAGTLNISNSTISNTITTSNTAALAISSGTINGALTVGGSGANTISGGSFTADVTTSANTTISGGTFSADKKVEASAGTLTITGGTFEGSVAIAETHNDGTKIAISGGTHTVLPVPGFCATGYMPIKTAADVPYTMTNHWTIVDDTNLSLNPHLADASTYGNYSVKTAEYQRHHGMVSAGNAKTMYGTICLPFEIKVAPTGMTLYKATEISGSTLKITAVTYTESVAAGTPLIFELSTAASTMTVTSTDPTNGIAVNTTAPGTAPVSGNLLVGTYQKKDISTGLSNIYYLNGDKFHQAKVSLTVPAFRAYLYYEAPVQDPTPAPSFLNICKYGEGEDEETAIQQIESLETVTEVYDLNGRKLNSLQRGVNIMRRADGSTIKVIVK